MLTLDTPTKSVMDSTVLLAVTLTRMGTRRKVHAASSTLTDGQPDLAVREELHRYLHISKDILASDELSAIKAHDNMIRSELAARALPSLFKAGISLLPISLIESTDALLLEWQDERVELVQAFLDIYPDRIAAAEDRLRGLFNPMDYPSADKAAAQFSFETQYLTFSTPTSLMGIKTGFFEREKAKAEKQWQEMTDNVRSLLRAQMQELVSHMVDTLAPDPAGRVKRFYGSSITNFAKFLELLPARNVTDDVELAKTAAQAARLLRGMTAEAVRDHRDVRQHLRSGMESVKAALDTMVTDAPVRAITFDED